MSPTLSFLLVIVVCGGDETLIGGFTNHLQVIIGVPHRFFMGEPCDGIRTALLDTLETFTGSVYDDPTVLALDGQPRLHPLY